LVLSFFFRFLLFFPAVNPSQNGYLTAFAGGQSLPLASTVNFVAGQTIANEATITLGNAGLITPGYVNIYNYQGNTDVVVDVQGYYAKNAIFGSFYYPISYPNPITGVLDNAPVRVLDTRAGSGQQGAGETLGASQTLSFLTGTSSFVPSHTLVPVGATAVVLNVTEADATASSFLTAWATGFGQPLASDVNFLANSGPVANRVIVPINLNTQTVSVYNNTGSTDVVVDLDGYFSPSPVEPTLCSPVTPALEQTVITNASPAGDPTGGTYTLTWDGVTTIPIAYNAADGVGPVPALGTILSALDGLTAASGLTFASLNATITGGPLPGSPVVVTYGTGSPPQAAAATISAITNTLTPAGTYTLTTTLLPAVFPAACPTGIYPGSVYYGLTAPARIADTRTGLYLAQTLGPLGIINIFVPPDSFGPGTGALAPAGFDGVDVNVTVTDTTASSFLTVGPSNWGFTIATLATSPTSDINWTGAGQIISNGDLIATPASIPASSITAFNYAGKADVVVDVYGYFVAL